MPGLNLHPSGAIGRRGLQVRRGIVAMVAAMGLAGQGLARDSSGMNIPAGAATVPVARVVNELKCDYLDFAYSDFARARRLAVGRMDGAITLAIVRDTSGDGTAGATGVAVADRPLRVDRDYVRGPGSVQNALTIPIGFDPRLALNPAAAGLDCSPGARLAQPIVGITALADTLTRVESGAPAFIVGSPVRWQGQFYLRRNAAGGTDVVLVKVDPARVSTDALYLQSVDLTVETGAASWFAATGPATAEPRPRDMPRAAARVAPADQVPDPASARRSRVITVPRAPVVPGRTVRVAPVEHRCVGSSPADMVCY